MDVAIFLILGSGIVGFYMAWTIGANDVANAMGTAVGSGTLKLKEAVVIAAVFEFLGAVLVGRHVTNTIQEGIVVPTMSSHLLLCGMFAALLGAAIWITIATYFAVPISTTHSIVGAVIGFGLASGYFSAININTITNIVICWFVSPVAGAIIALLIFWIIRKLIFNSKNPSVSAKKYLPFFVFMVFTILVLSIIYKGLKSLHLNFSFSNALCISFLVGVIAMFLSYILLKPYRLKKTETDEEEYKQVESLFGYLLILTACYIAFAHGANDVANAIGPLSAAVSILETGSVSSSIPLWVLGVGGIGIAFGIATWGYRVMETIGKKITQLTPTRGFAIMFGAATTVLFCSKLGLPVSTSQVVVGAVIGIGFMRGISAVNLNVIKKIVVSWVVTLPASALLSGIIYLCLKTL